MASDSAEQGLTGWLAANRNQGGLILMIVGIVLAAVPTWLASQYGADLLGIEIMTGLMSAVFLVAGVLLRFRPEGAGSPADEARMTVLGLGGITGFCIALLGLILNVQWWDFLTRWLRFGEREGAWKVLLAVVTLVAGLAVMFLTLASARSEERSSPVLRRLIYGYNAVLTGILLFLILAIVNVLAYLKVPAMVDSTESELFKLSDRSKQVLRALDRPVTIYLLMDTRSIAYDEMRTLLANAQEYAPHLHVETLSTGFSASQIRELQKQYPEIVSDGVLIIYGDEKAAPARFIPSEELVKSDSSGGERRRTFEGEARLITELALVSENKQKPVIYFASQNAAEFDFNDTDPQKDSAIGALRTRLGKRNFDVRPLKFDVADPKVPDDATIVVLPNPRQSYAQPIVNALQKYLMERTGRLVVLAEAPSGRRVAAMPETGLEALLASYKVELGKERILTFTPLIGDRSLRDPETVLANFSDAAIASKNPIAMAFEKYVFPFDRARVVRPVTGAAGGPNLSTETLIETLDRLPVWVESDMQTAPRQLIEAMVNDRKLLSQKISRNPVPLAVAVSESPAPTSGSAKPKPRLVVFGAASFISNRYMDESSGNAIVFDLFASTLDWLRERPSNIGIEPRTYKNYRLDPAASGFRLNLLPAIFALVGIVGLGAGVWVVRRR